MKTTRLLAAVLVGLAVASCGGDDEGAADTAPAGPVSIEEALAGAGDEPVVVRGNLLADGASVRLCSALAESFPPQCGGDSLLVQGLAYTELEGAVTVEGVTWTDRPIEVRGVVHDGTLTVSDNARR